MADMTVNNDFSAELLLNRVMNGQLKTSSGKTVTAGTRSTAASLDASALAMGVKAAKVGEAKTVAQGRQSALTELAAQVKALGDAVTSANGDTAAVKAAGAAFKANIDAILATDIDGTKVLSDAGLDVVLGADAAEKVTIGGVDISAGTTTGFAKLYAVMGTAPTTALVDGAIKELNQLIALQGAQYSLLSNRVDMLNDLGTTYQEASADQVFTAGGSASTLLNALG